MLNTGNHFILSEPGIDVAVNMRKKVYRQKMCNEINNNMENDPKKFWSLINKLSNASSGVVSDNVPHNEFSQHFKNLNTEDNNLNQSNSILLKFWMS